MPKLHGWQTISLSKEIIQEITEKVTTCWQITIFSQSFLNLKEYSELIQKEYSKQYISPLSFPQSHVILITGMELKYNNI